MTVDDYLPIIEISDSHPSSIGTDFAWLTKVCKEVSYNPLYIQALATDFYDMGCDNAHS